MNKLMVMFANQLPEPLLIKFVKFYVDLKIKKHVSLNVNGLDHLECDYKRPYLFVCNHLSNSDGLILNKVLEKENIIFLAGKKLKSNSLTSLGFKLVRSISIMPNSPDKKAIKEVINAVKEGNNILVFPEGTRSRTAEMLEGKKGILLFAKLTKAPIVPIGIWGTEQFMPIMTDMGKEAFYDAKININIGEVFNLPVQSDGVAKESLEADCLDYIMTRIAELLPEEYRGVYKDKISHDG